MTKSAHRSLPPIAIGAVAGAAAFGLAWLALDRAREGDSWPILWTGVWGYGPALGLGSAIAYGAVGGRGSAGAAASAALGGVLATVAAFAILLAGELGEQSLGSLIVGALVLFVYYAMPLGLVLLVAPAVTTGLAVSWTARALARLGAPTPE